MSILSYEFLVSDIYSNIKKGCGPDNMLLYDIFAFICLGSVHKWRHHLRGRGLEKIMQDVGGGGCWAKDDVTFNMILGEISNNFILKS